MVNSTIQNYNASSKPSLTVILPIYGRNIHLTTAIKSLMDQELQDYELIIGLDGENDYAEKILDSYLQDNRIKVFKFEHEGFIKTLNKLIQLVHTPFFARMDSDDYAHPERFKLQHNFLLENLDYSFVSCQYGFLSKNNHLIGRKRSVEHKEHLEIVAVDHLLGKYEYCDPGSMYRTLDVKRSGGYNEDIGIEKSLQLKLLSFSKGAILQKELMYVSINMNSLSRSPNWHRLSNKNVIKCADLLPDASIRNHVVNYFLSQEKIDYRKVKYNNIKKMLRLAIISRDHQHLLELIIRCIPMAGNLKRVKGIWKVVFSTNNHLLKLGKL